MTTNSLAHEVAQIHVPQCITPAEMRTRKILIVVFGLVAIGSSVLAAYMRSDAVSAKASVRKYVASVENSGAAMMVVNQHGIIESWSYGAERVTGWTAGEAVGYGLGFLIPRENRPAHHEAFSVAVEQGKMDYPVHIIRCKINRADGEQVQVQVTVRMDKIDKSFIAVIDPVVNVRMEDLSPSNEIR